MQHPKMKFINFFPILVGHFLPFWIRIRIVNPDPDPGTTLNPDPIRIYNTGVYLYISVNLGGEEDRPVCTVLRYV
jgi:hypothetical protein